MSNFFSGGGYQEYNMPQQTNRSWEQYQQEQTQGTGLSENPWSLEGTVRQMSEDERIRNIVNSKIAEVDAYYRARYTEMKDHFDKEMDDMKREYQEHISNVKEEFRSKISEMEAEYIRYKQETENYLSALRRKNIQYEKDIQEHQTKIGDVSYKLQQAEANRIKTEGVLEKTEGLLKKSDDRMKALIKENDKLVLKNSKLQEEVKQLSITKEAYDEMIDSKQPLQTIIGSLEQTPRAEPGPSTSAPVVYNAFDDSSSSEDNFVTAKQQVDEDTFSVLSDHAPVRVFPQEVDQNNRKKRHLTPSFTGLPGSISSQDWLHRFEKLTTYHHYTDEEQLEEFMMAMQGNADLWWRSLKATQKASISVVLQEFQNFFGGQDELMAHSISKLKVMKQGNESMTTFGPRLLLDIMTVTSDNFQLQMSYFYSSVNEEVKKAVMYARPKSLNQAISYAIELERNIANQVPGLPSTSKPTIIPSNPALGFSGDTAQPMEIDSNAQKAFYKNKNNSKSKKEPECYACGRTNHMVKDCKFVKDVQNSKKNLKGKKKYEEKKPRVNVQHIKEGSNSEVDQDVMDDLSNSV
ncbi:hypothetical protein BD770DRAFT_450200, partial [Pilaira anomala]